MVTVLVANVFVKLASVGRIALKVHVQTLVLGLLDMAHVLTILAVVLRVGATLIAPSKHARTIVMGVGIVLMENVIALRDLLELTVLNRHV